MQIHRQIIEEVMEKSHPKMDCKENKLSALYWNTSIYSQITNAICVMMYT